MSGDAAIDAAHLERQRAWSRQTFGPGTRLLGVLDHIRKELREIEENPSDVEEWIDVVILALDGAWRIKPVLDAAVEAAKAGAWDEGYAEGWADGYAFEPRGTTPNPYRSAT